MKNYLILSVLVLFSLCSRGQVHWPGAGLGNPKTVADTTVFMSGKIGGGNEQVIRNHTMDTLGLLTNISQGLTMFKRPRMINDSMLSIGIDTLIIHGTGKGDSLPFGILPTVRSLDTFNYHRVVNKPTIFVKETGKKGFFNITPKAGRSVDSVILTPTFDDTSSVWERKRDEATAQNLNWFASPGSTNDAKPGFIKAMAAAKVQGPNAEIYIPPGDWFFSDSIGIKQVIKIRGGGSRNTVLHFPSGKMGFVFFNADSPAGTTNSGAADNSEVTNLVFNQTLPYVGGFAIKENCAVYVHDCTFNDWGLQAIYIDDGAISPTLWGKLRSVIIANGKDGPLLSTTPTVSFSSPTGSGAAGIVHLGFSLATCSISDSGREYYVTPSCKAGPFGSLITEDNIDAIGFGGTVFPAMGLDSIHVITGGQNYTLANTHFVITGAAGGDNPTAVPVIVGGKVVGGIVTHRGRGFDQNSDIHIAITGDGTGATVFGTMLVVGATVTSGGGLYESNVALFFTGGRHGTGHDAAGTALIGTVGRPKRVELTSRGDNYIPGTTIATFSDPTIKAQVIEFSEGLGNANRWKLRNINVSRCLGAVLTQGGDANVGTGEQINAIACRGYAIIAREFLGSSWTDCHTELNQGSYMSTSNTAIQTIFKNCYGEGGQLPRVGINPAKLYGGDRGDRTMGSWKEPLETFTGKLPENGTVEFTQHGPNNDQTVALGGNTDQGVFMSVQNSSGEQGNQLTFSMNKESGTFGINFSPASPDADLGLKIFGRWWQGKFGNQTPQPFTSWLRFPRIGQKGEDVDSARLIMNSNHFPNVSDDIDLAKGDWIWNRNPNPVNKVVAWSVIKKIPADSNNRVAGVDYLPLVSAYGLTDTHIGNTDLNFTGTRIIHVKNFPLTFDSTNDFRIVRTSAAASRESLMRWYLSDGGNNHTFVANSHNSDGIYNPSIGGFFETGTGAVTNIALTTAPKDSSSGNALYKFRVGITSSNTGPLNGTITNVVNRDAYQFLNGFGNSELLNIGPLGQMRIPRYKNNSTLDSSLTTDINGNMVFKKFAVGSGGPETDPIANAKTLTVIAGTNVSIPEAATQTLGSNPSWTINATGGSTSLTGAQGDMIYFSATNTVANLAKNTSPSRYLSNQGILNNPLWSQINLLNGVVNALPTANGGTNNPALAPALGNVFYGDGTKIVSLTPGTPGQIFQTNGAAAPTWVTPMAQFNPIAGTNMSITGTYPNITFAATGISSGECDETDPIAILKTITVNASNGIKVNGGSTATATLGSNPVFNIAGTTLNASTTVNFSTVLPAGGYVDFDISVAGATFQDRVLVGSVYFADSDIGYEGYVKTDNVVTVRVRSRAPFDTIMPANMPVKVTVFK